MKIIFQKSRFIEKLTPAMGTVSDKNTITSIEGVLIETVGDSLLKLSTYDMRKGIVTEVECEQVIEPGSVIINASRLYQILKVMPGDSVTLSVDERYNATIESGASNFSLCALRGADFPNLPILSGERGFRIGAAILKKMLGKVIHSVGEAQESRPMLGGVFMKVEEGNIEVVSCDSITLSVCRRACDVEDIGAVVSASFSFIIPAHALQSLMRILPDAEEESVTVYLTRKHAIFRFDDLTFFTRLIDEDYIDYNRIMPKDQSIFVTVDRMRLLEGLERANLVAEEKNQSNGRSYVKLILDGNVLTMTSTSVSGKVYDEMECEHEGEGIEIGFNCRFLINSIRAAEGEFVNLTLKNARSCVTIEPRDEVEGEGYFYMVLPVRIND